MGEGRKAQLEKTLSRWLEEQEGPLSGPEVELSTSQSHRVLEQYTLKFKQQNKPQKFLSYSHHGWEIQGQNASVCEFWVVELSCLASSSKDTNPIPKGSTLRS